MLQKNNLPLVSVIMPTYNRKNLIKRAIDSCIHQSYKNIEIIVCDDHSTDGTDDYIIELRKNEPRILYCRTPEGHKGANAARNAGIRIAKGKYLCFLDSDDEFLENSIIDRVSMFEKHPEAGMVYGNAYGEIHRKKIPWVFYVMPQDMKAARKYLLENMALCIQSTIMVKTKVFSRIGMLDEQQKGWTDDGLVVAVGLRYPLLHCGTFVLLVHPTKVSMTSNKANMSQGLSVMLKKYKKAIISEVSLRRYILWQIRYVATFCYVRETSAKNRVTKYIWGVVHTRLKNIVRPYFRIYVE